MKKIIISIFVFTASLTGVSYAGVKVNYTVQNETWGTQNNKSGAPGPHCPCDKDLNIIDCTEDQMKGIEDLGPVCYDEYVPDDSDGYVHAKVYRYQK